MTTPANWAPIFGQARVPGVYSQAGAVGTPVFTSQSAPGGTVGVFYSYTFAASGSPTFSLYSGALPTGLTLSSSGVLSGTPTTNANYTFVVAATNGYGSTNSTTQSVSIAASGGTMAQLGFAAAHVEQLADYYAHRFWCDLIHSGRGFGATFGASDNAQVALDSNGWPTVACYFVLSSGSYPTLSTTSSAQLNGGDVCLGRVDKNGGLTAYNGCTITNYTDSTFTTVGTTTDPTYQYFKLTVTATTVGCQLAAAIPNGIVIKRPGFSVTDATVYNPAMLTYYGQYGGLRAMKLLATESGTTNYPPPLWVNRPTQTKNRMGGLYNGIVWEDLIGIANALYSAGGNFKRLGVNFHHTMNLYPSTTDYWTGAFTLLKNTLNSSIILEVEQSNEVWNSNYAAYGYYRTQGATRANALFNNIDGGHQDFTSVVCTAGNVVVQTASASGWSGHISVAVNTDTRFNVTNAAITVIDSTHFSYTALTVFSATLVMAGGGATGDNLTMTNSPGTGLDFDNICDIGNYAQRAYAYDVYRMAMVAETVFGVGSLNNQVRITIAWQQGNIGNALAYLNNAVPSRAPSTYLWSASFAPYLQPGGSDRTSILAGLSTQQTYVAGLAASWVQQAAYWGLQSHCYEIGIDFTTGSASTAVYDALQADTVLTPVITTLSQSMINYGVQTQYYHIATPLLELSNQFNITTAFTDTTSPKLVGYQAVFSVVPATTTAVNVAPGSNGTLTVAGTWGSVYDTDTFGSSSGTTYGWGSQGGHFGMQGGGSANPRWFEMMVLVTTAKTYTINLQTYLASASNKVWTISIDGGAGINYTVTALAGNGGAFFGSSSTAFNSDVSVGSLTAGYHKIRITTTIPLSGDQLSCDAVRFT